MLRPIPLLAALSALLAGCSDLDDLGRSVGGGPLQGQLLAGQDHGYGHEDHADEPGDQDEHEQEEEHDREHGDDEHGADSEAGHGDLDDVGHGEERGHAGEEGDVGAELRAVEAPPSVSSLDAAPEPVAPPPAAATRPEPAPAPAAAPAIAAASPAPSSGRFDPKSYRWIDFDPLIEFDYPELVRVDGDAPPELPEEVRALNGKRIAVEGFMNPLAFDSGGVKEFSLVADPSFCCFGAVPQMNHWIHVVLPDEERTEFYSFDPVAVYGTLEVGELYEDGYVVSLYRMVADRVEGDF